mgnify:CR=1 FL=1
MTALRHSLDAIAILTEEARSVLARRVRELGGLLLLLSAAAAALALASWSVRDPSLTNAVEAPVRNLLGRPGAIAADLLMQMVGLASIAVLLPVAVWGWRLLRHRRLDREGLRLGLWLLAILAGAGFASCLPTSKAWPLPSGLGGVIGDLMLHIPAFLGVPQKWNLFFAALFGLVMAVSLFVAAGFGLSAQPAQDADDQEDEAEGRSLGFIPLGWLFHGLLSLRARLMRLWRTPSSVESLRHEPSPYRPRAEDEEAADLSEPELDDEADEPPVRKRARKSAKPAGKRAKDGFVLPDLSLLAAPKSSDRATLSSEVIAENAQALEGVLGDFGVRGEIVNAHPGPVVTLYELEPAPGIKSSRVIGLADDIARSMSAVSARVAVVPGRNAIGIELPNPKREKVYLRELLASEAYNGAAAKLPLCLGKTIGGEPVIVDLARMPHLLIAGTTGSGKSVAINTMILSLLYRLKPDQCRLIMVDPKMLELSVYDSIPHLLTPVVTDPKKAVVALKWAVREMEDRYRKMSKLGVRNIDGYNVRVAEAKARGEKLTRTVHTGYDRETGEAIYEEEDLDLEHLPYIVVIVDEMADLMMVAGKDIEGAIQRLAQMARAAGIHVILATQRPSVDVITGTIKANFPTRISFQVTSKIDSRTILGEQGAEQLLGQGDMLYMAGGGRISRVHGPFVSDEEVEKIVRHLKTQGAPQYLDAVTASDELDDEDGAVFDATAMGAEGGDMYQQAVQIVLRDRKASTSYIQRRLQIGYNRAASIMERMEDEGVVGPANHAGKREILIGADE